MRFAKKGWVLLACLGMLACCSGCFLLPEEQQLPEVPLLDQEAAPEYETAEVVRGDLVHTEELSCRVVAREEEKLCFSVTGQTIRTVFVSEGDRVQAGDLIAELADEETEQELSQVEDQLQTLRTDLDWAQKDLEICQGASSLTQQAEDYAARVQDLTDQITVLEQRLQELETIREGQRLYCSIDGVVTQARSSGSMSFKSSPVATVVSRVQSEYYTDTPFYEAMPDGMQTVITIGGTDYEAVVTGREPAPEKPDARDREETVDQMRVFLTVTDSRADEIDSGKQGTLVLTVASREDVLILPASAVVYSGDRAMVYCAEEDTGVMQVREVQAGLVADGRIEIISGLSEGDRVILD